MNLLEVLLLLWVKAQFLIFQTTLLLFFRPIFVMFKNTDLLPQTPSSAIIGEPFRVLPQVESTNNYAMALAHEGLATHGMAIFSAHQTAGKGQRGKIWQSNAGENIALSVIIRPTPALQGFQLSALVALACRDWYESHVKSEVFVKWPNDIYWRDRKAAGILIENIVRENVWQWSVIGIGVNVNQTKFSPQVGNAVSLKQVTGQEFNPEQLALELCTVLDRHVQRTDIADVLSVYNQHLYMKEKTVRLKKGSAVFQTTVTGVNAYGDLLTVDSTERSFSFGEVEWLL